PRVPLEARVEELGRVLQGSPLGEGQLHDRFVRLAGADDPVMRPYGSARRVGLDPLPLLHDVGVCLFDQLAHPAQGLPPPVLELGDSLVNQLRCRPALGRTRLLHVLLRRLAIPLTNGDRPARGRLEVCSPVARVPDVAPRLSSVYALIASEAIP